MSTIEVDATNACIPTASPLSALFPPLPTTVRGEPCILDGQAGRYNGDRPILLYGNGRCVIVRYFDEFSSGGTESSDDKKRIKAFVYRGHTAQVTCAKFSPSGAYVASADIRGKLRVWSYDNEEHFCKLDIQGMAGPIRGISWCGDNNRICIVGQVSPVSKTNGKDSNSCTRVFTWNTGVSCGELGRHRKNRVSCCDFKKTRPMRVVTGGTDDHTVSINKGPPFEFLHKSETGHSRGSIHCLKYNPQGDVVVSVGADHRVTYWDGKTLELLRTETGHTASIYSCDWSADGTKLITAGADGYVKLTQKSGILKNWNVVGKQLAEGHVGKIPYGGMQLGCAFMKGDIPVSVGVNGKLAVLNEADCDDIQFLEGHQYPITCMAFDKESDVLFTGDSEGIICRWDLEIGHSRRLSKTNTLDKDLTSVIHGGTITGMQYLSGSLLSIGWDDMLRISNNQEAFEEIKLESQPNFITAGSSIVAIVMVNHIGIFKDGSIISCISDLSYTPSCAAVSPDDSIVCVGSTDKNIYVYSISNGSLVEVEVLTHHLKEISSLGFSPDGSYLASGDLRDIVVWDTSSWSTVIGKNRWCFHGQRITHLCWSPDGKYLASAGVDDNIFIWSLKKKMKRLNYKFCHRGGVTGLAWRNTNVLLSAGSDSCVAEWNLKEEIKAKFG